MLKKPKPKFNTNSTPNTKPKTKEELIQKTMDD